MDSGVILMVKDKEKSFNALCISQCYLLDIPNESRKAPINFLFQKEKKMGVPRILGYNSLSTNPDTTFLRENTI